MRIKTINFLYLILGLFGFKSSPAVADIFLCIPEIAGDITAQRYMDCIDAQSWQWGAGVGISRTGGKVEVSRPSLSEVTISKQADSSSVDLMNYLVSAKAIPKLDMYIDECGSCTDGEPRVKFTMTDVYISGFSQSSGGNLPSESVSFNYGSIEWCYSNAELKQPLECGGYNAEAP